MGQQLPNWAFEDFVERVHHHYQAKERLMGTTRERPNIKAELTKFPVMGSGTATKRTAAQVKLELMSVVHERVSCTLDRYNASDMTDIWDQSELPIDEREELAKVIAGGLGRRRDQMKIDAMIAAAGSITNQVAATGFGTENTLNIERLLEAKRLLNVNEVDEEVHIAVHATDIAQALALVEFGSADYNTLRALQNGGINQQASAWGFTWHILGDRTEGGLAVASSVRQCWAWTRNAVGSANAELGKNFDISWLADYGSWITSGFMNLGACVIDPRGVVEILCDET